MSDQDARPVSDTTPQPGNRHKEPEPPVYDPALPTGFANPRPTGDGDPAGHHEQVWHDPDSPDHQNPDL